MTGTTSQSRSVPKSRPNWPWRTFVSAWSEGALAISPEMSSAFLNDVWNLATGGKLNRSNIQTILQGGPKTYFADHYSNVT